MFAALPTCLPVRKQRAGEEVIIPKFVLQIIILAFQRMLMGPSGLIPLGPLKATEVVAMVD